MLMYKSRGENHSIIQSIQGRKSKLEPIIVKGRKHRYKITHQPIKEENQSTSIEDLNHIFSSHVIEANPLGYPKELVKIKGIDLAIFENPIKIQRRIEKSTQLHFIKLYYSSYQITAIL
ncbi:hypothetical protein HAX54_036947 [Datura stramonium]|uniref:Uncharacterized protein n=1 Tax=Datura stramonium TaxID=4076 RepID=A0ABS8SGY6_DATST|nr:hypothetical protein [Datura stramonium]